MARARTFRIIAAALFGLIAFLIIETEMGIGEGTSWLGLLLIAIAALVGYSLPRRSEKSKGQDDA
jgi:hypothetical protein